jgi:hypothetical protein
MLAVDGAEPRWHPAEVQSRTEANRVVELPEIDPGALATIPEEWWELIPQVESAFAS